jgi:cytochrome b561
MPLRNTTERYGWIAQLLHWVIAVGFIFQFALAYYMEPLPLGPYKAQVYNLHKSIGVTLLVLAVLRLGWRWMNPVPPLPSGRPRWEELASRASHVGLYGMILLHPLTGLGGALFSKFPSEIWGVTLPRIATDDAISSVFGAAHYWLHWVIMAVVAIHVAAALRHHFVLKDDVLVRMLPVRRQAGRLRKPS